MRAVLQRVSQAKVTIDDKIHSQINHGLLVFLGIEPTDSQDDIHWLSKKIVQMRIFSDEAGLMNLSIKEVKGSILLVSQFTLHAATQKGNRPSFMKAASPAIAQPLYEQMIQQLTADLGQAIQTGVFGADMNISLNNNGPVTILIDSKSEL